MDYLKEADAMLPDLIQWRRDFHMHPELRFEEVRTSSKVAEHLRGLGLEVQTGVGKTGVVGLLTGSRPGPVALMRFDMDALPIQEENDVPYKSQNPGVMHACGHDSHMAMGIGVAKLLVRHRDELQGSVKFVFQPAEEGAGGALAMIRDGVLENPRPDVSFGLHVQSQTPARMVLVGDGPILTAADTFRCTVHGKGGHGAIPQLTIDPVVAAAQIISALQTIVSRNVDPLKMAVISVCTLNAGSAFNVIPDVVEMSGTLRSYEPEVRDLICQRMQAVVENTANAFGASAELTIEEIVPAAINHPAVSKKVRELASSIVGPDLVSADEVGTASDDIAEFLRAVPGCHFILGVSKEGEDRPQHTPRFDMDESVMPYGVALLAAEAMYFLAHKESIPTR